MGARSELFGGIDHFRDYRSPLKSGTRPRGRYPFLRGTVATHHTPNNTSIKQAAKGSFAQASVRSMGGCSGNSDGTWLPPLLLVACLFFEIDGFLNPLGFEICTLQGLFLPILEVEPLHTNCISPGPEPAA